MEPRVYISIPSRGGDVNWQVMEHIKLAAKRVSHFAINISVSGSSIASGRNESVKGMLGTKCTHLMFFGEEIVPPANAIVKLLAHDAPVASGCYPIYTQHGGAHLSVSSDWNKDSGAPIWMPDWFDGTAKTKYCKFGCTLIRRDVLEAIEFPWFVWHPDVDPDAGAAGRTDESMFLERTGEDALVDGRVRCWNSEKTAVSAMFAPA